jgi:hypothetical protein
MKSAERTECDAANVTVLPYRSDVEAKAYRIGCLAEIIIGSENNPAKTVARFAGFIS